MDSHTGPCQVLPIRARVNQGAMVMKRYSIFPRGPGLEAHHQIVGISRTFDVDALPLCRSSVGVFNSPPTPRQSTDSLCYCHCCCLSLLLILLLLFWLHCDIERRLSDSRNGTYNNNYNNNNNHNRSIRRDATGSVRWFTGKCVGNLNSTILANGICTTQHLSWKIPRINSYGTLTY